MKKMHNFNSGPCVLPKAAVEATIKAIKDFDHTGIGVMEISHRTAGWERIMEETRQLWRELLGIPNTYEILFLTGGASTQFLLVPANLMQKKAAYLQTGVWATKAIREAENFGEVTVVATSEDKKYNYIPKSWSVPADADYFHITTNNTIYGTEIHRDFLPDEVNGVPVVADMSSDILSRPMDVTKYGLIYGGAQKNVGTAGVTFVIVRKDLLGKIGRRTYMNPLPTILDYRTHAVEDPKFISMFHTPPVLPIFVMHETLRWLKESMGGVDGIHKINVKKSAMLYEEIDRNPMFSGTVANKEDRSIMNHCWTMAPGHEDKQADFEAYAQKCGMTGIKGHRAAGGFRAALYNACTLQDVEALVDCMQKFEKKYR